MQMWMKRRYELQMAQGSKQTRRQRGFTLIEIMVVIAILGILAALIVPKIMSRPDEARRVAAKADIGSIMQSLNLYRLDNGRYPTQEQGCARWSKSRLPSRSRTTGKAAATWIAFQSTLGARNINT